MNIVFRFIAILCTLFPARASADPLKWYPSSVHSFIEQKLGSSAIITACIHERWTNFTLFYMPYNNSTGFKHRKKLTTFLDTSEIVLKLKEKLAARFEPGFEEIEIAISNIQLSDEGFYFHEVDDVKYYSTWIIVLSYEPLLLQAAVLFGVLAFFALLCTCGWWREKQYQKSRRKKLLYIKNLH
ncbi:unnamed protein product [Oikopleura dioica]|uniref:Uncharacterized protein n=1 Tax=Oikopleura dioica TaxID=34765 RepID=E4WVY8_OIKDI|nr:unnamed protein product [Oikopleura dioica]